MIRRRVISEILFALTLVSIALSPLRTTAQTNQFTSFQKATRLIGMKVEDIDGQKDGTVRNLVMDIGTGQLKYVVIASGGFFGVHSTLKLVPLQAMSTATTKRDTLAIGVTTEQWERAPVFKSSDLATFAQSNLAREIALFYRHPETRSAITNQHPLSSTGSNTNRQTNATAGTLKFASDLIGS